LYLYLCFNVLQTCSLLLYSPHIYENSLSIFSHKTLEYTPLTAYMNGMHEILLTSRHLWLKMTDNFFLSWVLQSKPTGQSTNADSDEWINNCHLWSKQHLIPHLSNYSLESMSVGLVTGFVVLLLTSLSSS